MILSDQMIDWLEATHRHEQSYTSLDQRTLVTTRHDPGKDYETINAVGQKVEPSLESFIYSGDRSERPCISYRSRDHLTVNK